MIQSDSADQPEHTVDWDSQRIWSLWDMLRIYPDAYMRIGSHLADLEVGVYWVSESTDDAQRIPVLTDEQKKRVDDALGALQEFSLRLGLTASAAKFARAIYDPPQTEREFKHLREDFEDEQRSRLFLLLASERQKFFVNEGVLSEDARPKFATSYNQLRTASRCYALEMDTASVFHCMQALEPALAALARDVGESIGSDSWNTVIERIESRIATEGKGPRTSQKSERLKFLSEAAVQFRYFKDGWRNHIAHGRESYDQQKALEIFEHVTSFVGHLATRLAETS